MHKPRNAALASPTDMGHLRSEINTRRKDISKLVKKFAGEFFIIIIILLGKKEIFIGKINANATGLIKRKDSIGTGSLTNDYAIPTDSGWVSIEKGSFEPLKEPMYLHMPRKWPKEKRPDRLSWTMRDIFFSEMTPEASAFFRHKRTTEITFAIGNEKCEEILSEMSDIELVAKITDLLKF